MRSQKNNQLGFAASYLALLVLLLVMAVALSLAFVLTSRQKVLQNLVMSLQSYYAAESGAEDALLRLKNGMNWSSPYTFGVSSASSEVTISDIVGGARTIGVKGNLAERIRKVQAVYQITVDNVSFYYGAQVGNGGLQMDNLSKVIGNVFSDGTITAQSLSEITGTVIVAGAGNKIIGADVSGNASVDICQNSDIAGVLYALDKGNCAYGTFSPLSSPPSPVPLPISDSQISEWKLEAEAGGTLQGNLILSGSQKVSLGPQKISGNLLVENLAELTVTGTLWVTGNIDIKNDSKIRLSSAYDSLSGLIITDGYVVLQNNSISSGSGSPGSYLMYLSTLSANPAGSIRNNAIVDILYTSSGWIEIQNNARMRELIGYGVHVKNNATITYEVGLANVLFTAGPGGGWQVTDWKEVE